MRLPRHWNGIEELARAYVDDFALFFIIGILLFLPDQLCESHKMIIIQNYGEFETYLGKELGTSGWHTITQQQIDQFADATLDHQWIHTDPVRAVNESPFKATIAHGYLTVSLLPYFWHQIADIQNLKMQINYGIENLRFAQPVLTGSEVRLKAKLVAIVNLRGVTKATIGVEMEIKDEKKPAYTGEVVFLYHFIG